MRSISSRRRAACGVGLGFLVLAGIAAAAPQLGQIWVDWLFSGACHQRAERCLNLADGPMGVCARCWGIYLGLGLGSVAWARYPFRCRRAGGALAAALALNLSDYGLEQVGAYQNEIVFRLFLGLALGLAIAVFVWRGSPQPRPQLPIRQPPCQIPCPPIRPKS